MLRQAAVCVGFGSGMAALVAAIDAIARVIMGV